MFLSDVCVLTDIPTLNLKFFSFKTTESWCGSGASVQNCKCYIYSDECETGVMLFLHPLSLSNYYFAVLSTCASFMLHSCRPTTQSTPHFNLLPCCKPSLHGSNLQDNHSSPLNCTMTHLMTSSHHFISPCMELLVQSVEKPHHATIMCKFLFISQMASH